MLTLGNHFLIEILHDYVVLNGTEHRHIENRSDWCTAPLMRRLPFIDPLSRLYGASPQSALICKRSFHDIIDLLLHITQRPEQAWRNLILFPFITQHRTFPALEGHFHSHSQFLLPMGMGRSARSRWLTG